MHSIDFHFEASPTSNDDQVRPLVDGADFLRTHAEDSLGIDPPEFFCQPALGLGGKLLVGRCSCGVVGCGDIMVDIAVSDQSVTWKFMSNPAYHFELKHYLDSFKSASENTVWESIGRTAERLVSSIDFANLKERGYRFEWASTRIARGRITLSFSCQDTQRLFEIGWDDQQAADAVTQVRRWAAEYA